ncbi:MAG TPA: HRDC domain-containing protein [Pirellulales bacterium]|nr:HRDC domain-containing protein [Pirellulales bacterium]
MSHLHITTAGQLADFTARLAGVETIAFDTEFVSEDTYRSDLCLIQVAVGEELAVIDPLTAGDVTPFWEAIASGGHETIVHAGREELVFCLAAAGRRPARLFDIQIAAGLVGYEYPAGYGALLAKVLGERPQKGETRTDWRRRPLSQQQIEYALDDVRYLRAIRDRLHAKLSAMGRLEWMQTEMTAWQDDVETARSAERWRRVSGTNGLSSRSLAIVRELWRWREAEAARRDSPVRRVLRDDLIVELAKRRSADPKQIRAVRGLDRGDLQRLLPKLAEHVALALDLPESELPRTERRETPNQINLLGQFLSAALSSICRSAQIAPSIVGTASDVRELIAFRMGYGGDEPPALAQGWRAEIVGQLIDDLLAGRKSIRIGDPTSEEPLVFDPTNVEGGRREA